MKKIFLKLMRVQRQAAPLKFRPIQVFIAFALLDHFDTIFDRTHQLAKIAADTFGVVDGVRIIRCTPQ